MVYLGEFIKILSDNPYVIIRSGYMGEIEFEGHIYFMVLSEFMRLEDREIVSISIESKTSEHKMFIQLAPPI